MKNFDFPYINDSPVDLSGREGADKPTDLSGIHDGATCECEMCVWANRQEREMLQDKVNQLSEQLAANQVKLDELVCSDIDEVLMSLSPFAVAWASAPESRWRHVEQEDAEYWWKQGRMSANSAAIEDLNTIESMMKARGLK